MHRLVKQSLSVLVLASCFLQLAHRAEAAALVKAAVRPSRMTANFAASTSDPILVIISPATVGTENNIYITWAAGYTVNATNTNITTNTTCVPTTFQGAAVTALNVGANASAVSGQNVTFLTGLDLAVGTTYGFCITGGITNPSGTATGYVSTITTRTGANATIDSSRIATYNLAGSDQVTIEAQVPPTFTMALSTNTLTFASDLTTTPQNSPTMTVTLTTNARNGWAAWIKSLNGGLKSGTSVITTDNDDPNACLTKDAGESFYQFNVSGTALGASGTRTAITNLTKFNNCGAGTGGSFIGANTWQEFSRNDGTTSGDVLTIHAIAAIGGWEPAAVDYTDTWTIIGAANF